MKQHPSRRGASLIELLIVVGVLVVLLAIVASMITGSGGNPGVKENVERQIAQIELYYMYQGFAVYASGNDGWYPSTEDDTRMDSDTTHQVFKVLVEDRCLDARQLVSQNEYYADEITIGSPSTFAPGNVSFALPDYDADGWIRHDLWNDTQDSQFALMSDRLYDNPDGPEGLESINIDFWHVLFNDGHTERVKEPYRPNTDDYLFDYDEDYGKYDALMVHD